MMEQKKKRKKPFAILGGVAIIGAFAWLMWGGIDGNIVYFLTTSELHAKGSEGYDKPVRVGGAVEAGSIRWDADNLDLRFNVTDGSTVLPVHSRGAPPQMFADGMEVILEGRYGRDGIFQSKTVMVKHSNEYHPPKEGEMPEELYKGLKQRGVGS
jgi:cytochrome c-type biogenesis protein CcmE